MKAGTRHRFPSRLSGALLLWSLILGVNAGASRPEQQPLKLDGYPTAGAPAEVTLLAPGAEPRILLRYAVPTTYRDHISMNMLMSISMQMAGMDLPPMQMPSMKLRADLDVTGVTTSGDISYNLAFSGFNVESTPGVDPAVSAALQGLDADYKALKETSTISNRGILRASSFDVSKVTNPQLRQTLESVSSTLQNLSMPLPEEAVGVGARWEVRQALASSGMQSFQKSVFEVVSLSGKMVTLKTTIEQTAPPQAFVNPAMPPGTDVRLQKFAGTGTGSITLRLDSLVPTSEATIQDDAVMQISMAGGTQTMTTATTLRIGISSVK